jgi:hypothetical protein
MAKERDGKTERGDIPNGKAIESPQPTIDKQLDREGGIER